MTSEEDLTSTSLSAVAVDPCIVFPSSSARLRRQHVVWPAHQTLQYATFFILTESFTLPTKQSEMANTSPATCPCIHTGNMSRTWLYDCHIFEICIDNFMRISDFGMLKSNIDVFLVTSFLCSLKFVLFHRIEASMKQKCIWLSFCDRTVPSKRYVPSLWPWYLTYEGQCVSRLSTTLYVSCITFRSISLLIAEK